MNKRSIIYYFAGIVTTLSIATLYNLLYLREHSYARRKKAVFFGDSITQHGSNTSNHGWVARFTEWYNIVIDYYHRMMILIVFVMVIVVVMMIVVMMLIMMIMVVMRMMMVMMVSLLFVYYYSISEVLSEVDHHIIGT